MRVVLDPELVTQSMLVHTDDSPVPALDTLSDYGAPEPLVIDGVHRGEHYAVNGQYIVNVFVAGCVQPPLVIAGDYPWSQMMVRPSIDIEGLHHQVRVQSSSSSLVKAWLTSSVVRHLGAFKHRRMLLMRWEPSGTGMLLGVIDHDGPHPVSYRAAVAWARQLLSTSHLPFELDQHEPLDTGAIDSALAMVTAETSWLEGATQRVGNGCESRLTLDEPAVTCVVQVQPHSDRWTIKLEGRLGGTAPEPCSLLPQRGFSGHIKGMFDQKFGDDDVDRAFLIRGHAGAVQGMVTADELVQRSGDSLTVSVHGDHFSAELQPTPADAGAALSFVLGWWRRVARRSAGIDRPP